MDNSKSKASELSDEFLEAFNNVERQISHMKTPDNFEFIYKCALKFAEQYGVGPQLIEKIYILGYNDGVKKTLKKTSSDK